MVAAEAFIMYMDIWCGYIILCRMEPRFAMQLQEFYKFFKLCFTEHHDELITRYFIGEGVYDDVTEVCRYDYSFKLVDGNDWKCGPGYQYWNIGGFTYKMRSLLSSSVFLSKFFYGGVVVPDLFLCLQGRSLSSFRGRRSIVGRLYGSRFLSALKEWQKLEESKQSGFLIYYERMYELLLEYFPEEVFNEVVDPDLFRSGEFEWFRKVFIFYLVFAVSPLVSRVDVGTVEDNLCLLDGWFFSTFGEGLLPSTLANEFSSSIIGVDSYVEDLSFLLEVFHLLLEECSFLFPVKGNAFGGVFRLIRSFYTGSKLMSSPVSTFEPEFLWYSVRELRNCYNGEKIYKATGCLDNEILVNRVIDWFVHDRPWNYDLLKAKLNELCNLEESRGMGAIRRCEGEVKRVLGWEPGKKLPTHIEVPVGKEIEVGQLMEKLYELIMDVHPCVRELIVGYFEEMYLGREKMLTYKKERITKGLGSSVYLTYWPSLYTKWPHELMRLLWSGASKDLENHKLLRNYTCAETDKALMSALLKKVAYEKIISRQKEHIRQEMQYFLGKDVSGEVI